MSKNFKLITLDVNGEKILIDVLVIPDFHGGLADREDIIKRIFPLKYTTDFAFEEEFLSMCNRQIKNQFIDIFRNYLSDFANKHVIYPASASAGYSNSFFPNPGLVIQNISFKNILIIGPIGRPNMYDITIEALNISKDLSYESIALMAGYYQDSNEEETAGLINQAIEKYQKKNSYLVDTYLISR